MTLSFAQIKQYIVDELGDTMSSTLWSDAQYQRAIEAEVDHLATQFPLRTAHLKVSGDANFTDIELPERASQIIGVLNNTAVIPPMPYLDSIGQIFGRTTLTKELFGSYGWAFSPPNHIRFSPPLQPNEVRDVYIQGQVGTFRYDSGSSTVAAYSTGTISILQDSTTVTGLGTLWLTALAAGQVITFAGRDFIIREITSDTILEITEEYAGSSLAGVTYTAGSSLIVDPTNIHMISLGVMRRLLRRTEDARLGAIDIDYAIAKREARARYQRLAEDWRRYKV